MCDRELVVPKSLCENRATTIGQNTMTLPVPSDSSSKCEDCLAKIAVTVFPSVILGVPIGGLPFPAQTAPLVKNANRALMVIMFGMGLILMPPDFGVIARRPWPALVGVLVQYIITSLAVLAMTWAFRLDSALAVGVILVGCASGGIASNVVACLAKDDVVLLVVMTAVSTLLSLLVIPTLTKYLTSQHMPADVVVMARSIMMIAFVPVILGLLLRSSLLKFAEVILPALSQISVLGVSYAVAALVGASSTRILSAGLVVLAAVTVRNGLGLALGYFAAKSLRVGEKAARTTAIEVGMQNSGLVATLGATYFTPEVAVLDAVFSVWHSVSGSAFAAFFQRRPITG